VLSPCPTIWKMNPVAAQHWVTEVMEKTFPLGVFCDKTAGASARVLPEAGPALEEIPRILGVAEEDLPVGNSDAVAKGSLVDLHVRVAGFGGQGVLLLGEMLAEAGLDAGLEVSWLPSYGPEIRSGTSNCHVRLSQQPIDSPMVMQPNLLVAMNEPSLRKFIATVRPGGWIFYNGDEIPEDCARGDVHALAAQFTHEADQIGDARAGNMVMLGALLECTGAVPQISVDAALRRLVKHKKWIDLDELALEKGRTIYRESCTELSSVE